MAAEPAASAYLLQGLRIGFLTAPVVLLLLLLGGCQSTSTLGTDAQRPYQWENLPHHPSYAWHRHRSDSATVFIQLPAHEPLHLRENRDLPFRYSLKLSLVIQPTELPDGDTLDLMDRYTQIDFRWQGEADPDRQKLTARFTFPLPLGRYQISHTLMDLHRGAQVTGALLMDAWLPDAPVRSLPFNTATGEPVWDMQLSADTEAGLLIPPDQAARTWAHSFLPPVDTFPSAPFLDRTPAVLEFPESGMSMVPVPAEGQGVQLPPGNWRGWGLLRWPAEPGVHRWSTQAEGRPRAVVLPARRPHFPVMRDVEEMIRATRYIATRDEYRTMREARDLKKALDTFWMQFSGSAEEARNLIRTYYGRVHEANVHFSGLREGWRTDRGMVMVVFGHPDRTRRDRYGETWIYGEEGDINALIFRFSRRPAGDDFNVLELERYPGFRSPWEAMVSSWRRGKIRRR